MPGGLVKPPLAPAELSAPTRTHHPLEPGNYLVVEVRHPHSVTRGPFTQVPSAPKDHSACQALVPLGEQESSEPIEKRADGSVAKPEQCGSVRKKVLEHSVLLGRSHRTRRTKLPRLCGRP